MFGNLGLPEILVIGVVALLIFGPERLPKAAADAGRIIRQLKAMSQNTMSEVKAELGPELSDLDLASLHPRRLIADHIFGDDAPASGRDYAAEMRAAAERSDHPQSTNT